MYNEERFEKLYGIFREERTVAGEMLRAVAVLRDRFYNYGDFVGIDRGNETCNAPARYLKVHGGYEIKDIVREMWGLSSMRFYGAILDTLTDKICIYIERHPNLKSMWTESMWDYRIGQDKKWMKQPDINIDALLDEIAEAEA